MSDAAPGANDLFEAMGGQEGVDDSVSAFYARIFADPELRPFFEHSDQVKLVAMQQEFFSAALGGPVTYSGTSLREAHAGRGIQPRHLARFAEHLLATLRERGLSADAAETVVARIAVYSDDVLGEVGEDG